MKKYEKIIIIFLILIGIYFIGKTVYNKSLQKQESIIAEQQNTIDSLNIEIEIMETESEILKEDFNLLIKYYCASENLFDTIFYHFTNDGTFVFQYEPYVQVSNELYEYELFYEFLEEKRKMF